METSGILLIAYNNEIYYRYACNLAHSIKINSNKKIQIICDDKINKLIEDDNSSPFDYVTNIKEVYCSPGEMKIMMYDLSMFEKTLFIDVDSLLFTNIKIDWIFNEFNEMDFMCANGGTFNIKESQDIALVSAGGTIAKFVNHFNIENTYLTKVYSFFVYFKKCESTKRYFDETKNVYKDLSKNSIILGLEDWNGCVNDEIAFSIASSLLDFHPSIPYYQPFVVGMDGIKGMFNELVVLLNMKGKIGITMPKIDVHSHNMQLYNMISSVVGVARKVKTYNWETK